MKRKKLVCLLTAFAVMIGMAGCIKEEKKADKKLNCTYWRQPA